MASRQENAAYHDEVRRPLVDGGLDHQDKGYQWMVYLSTFVAVGYSSPTQSAIREDLNLTLSQFSMFGSIVTFGAMIGAVTIGSITDLIGRKGALRFSSIICVVGWLAIYFSKGAMLLDIGRMATGYGMGAFSYVVPVFIAEIAPKHLRGTLTALNQLLIVAGVSVSFVIGVVVSWRTLALIGLIPCAVTISGLCFIPESPRWLEKTGNQRQFEDALQKLRGRDADISKEAEEIQDYIATLDRLPKAKFLDLFERRYSRSLVISVGLMICQQLGGINGVCFYVSNIFEQAGFSPSIGTITYAVLQVVVTAIRAAIMDKAGRKLLVLTSATWLLLGCVLTAMSFYFKVNHLSPEAVPVLAVTGILVFSLASSKNLNDLILAHWPKIHAVYT